nr:MAG TPA: hypothetical protein [Caudoviricetes sp.]
MRMVRINKGKMLQIYETNKRCKRRRAQNATKNKNWTRWIF